MSLSTLVAFAQMSFGAQSKTTDEPSESLASGARDSDVLSPRSSIPDWLRARRPDDEAPVDSGHQWRIHGEISSPPPPPDVDRVGPDALAFYVPFHFYTDWGIYIRDSGVKYLAFVLKGSPLIPGDEEYLVGAEWILNLHEMWHAATEIACTRAELFARRSLYREYFFNEDASVHEEALANAHAIRKGFDEDTEAAKLNVEHWMRGLGPGYRHFDKWIPRPAFSRGQNVAARFMTAGLPGPRPKASGAPHQFLFRGAHSYRSMPVTRIVDSESNDASVVRPFPRDLGMRAFVYSNDHEPAHFHIETLARDFKTRYLWPSLEPYEGNPGLTGKKAKAFDKYWRKYKDGIVSKLRKVYPSVD